MAYLKIFNSWIFVILFILYHMAEAIMDIRDIRAVFPYFSPQICHKICLPLFSSHVDPFPVSVFAQFRIYPSNVDRFIFVYEYSVYKH